MRASTALSTLPRVPTWMDLPRNIRTQGRSSAPASGSMDWTSRPGAARASAVFNVPDYGTSEVADHAIALMLALTRGVITYNDAIRADPATGWTQGIAPAVRRLRDAVFGIVGLGRIGLAAANRGTRLRHADRLPRSRICRPAWRSPSARSDARAFTN